MKPFHIGVVITALLFASPQAWAYLDPGSASLILQGFIAGILSVMAVMRLYWHRIKQFFSRTRGPDTNHEGKYVENTNNISAAATPPDDSRDPH